MTFTAGQRRFLYGLLVVVPAKMISLVEDLCWILTLGWTGPDWSLTWYFKVGHPISMWLDARRREEE